MSITNRHISDMAYAASMYALGRQTMIVESVADAVLAALPQCDRNDRRVIADRAESWLTGGDEYKHRQPPLPSERVAWQAVIDEARRLNTTEAA